MLRGEDLLPAGESDPPQRPARVRVSVGGGRCVSRRGRSAERGEAEDLENEEEKRYITRTNVTLDRK